MLRKCRAPALPVLFQSMTETTVNQQQRRAFYCPEGQASRQSAMYKAQREAKLASLTEEQIADYHRDGIVAVPRYLPDSIVGMLRGETEKMIDAERELRANESSSAAASKFDARKSTHQDDMYFLQSGDKVRCFLEPAVANTAEVSVETVNKVAHALHTKNELYRDFVSYPAFGSIARSLGRSHPNVVQSMYILKPPRVGGEVGPHQDSTWIHSTPLSCLGIWFALDDCTVKNACLHAVRGSHQTQPLTAHCKLTADRRASELHGELPNMKYDEMEAFECPRGSMVIFDGLTVHGSSANTSDKKRHAFVFHLVDDVCTWSKSNWMDDTVSRLAL